MRRGARRWLSVVAVAAVTWSWTAPADHEQGQQAKLRPQGVACWLDWAGWLSNQLKYFLAPASPAATSAWA